MTVHGVITRSKAANRPGSHPAGSGSARHRVTAALRTITREAIPALTAVALAKPPTAAALLRVLTAAARLTVPTGAALIRVPTGAALLQVLTGLARLRVLTAAALPAVLTAAVLLTALPLPMTTFAATPSAVTIRSGNHPDFGRVVFDAPAHARYNLVRDGDRLTVQFAPGIALQGAPALPRNVAALHADGSEATLTLAPGSTIHASRIGDHVVIDVFDAGPANGQSGQAPSPQRAAAAPPSQAAVPAPHPAASSPAASGGSAQAAPVAGTLPLAASSPTPAASPLTAASPPPAHTALAPAAASPSPAAGPLTAGRLLPTVSPLGAAGPLAAGSPLHAIPAALTAAVPLPPPPPLPTSSPLPGEQSVAATAPEVPPLVPVADPQPPQPLEPPPLRAQPVALPPDQQGAAFSLPLPADSGAAVFRRHGETLVVFDQRCPLDLSAVQAMPAFGSARVELFPAATLLHLAPPAGTTVTLEKTAQGWTVAAVSPPASPQRVAVAVQVGDTTVSLAAKSPGSVTSVQDPSTGVTLLVGTQSQPGQAMLVPYRTPQFDLLPTEQGVVVFPWADTVALRPVADGFVVTTDPAPLELSRLGTGMLSDPAALTRRFDFPNQPPEQLTEQLAKQIAAAAEQPLLDRAPARRAAALTMISLGMDAEAEALLQLIARDDPRQAASTDLACLTGIAALLAGRPAEAGAIDNPAVTGTDEIELWRALLEASRNEASPGAAAALVSTGALLLTYPPGIRDKVLPLAAETMVEGGATAAARELLARSKGLPGLDLARAMLSQAEGRTGEALAQYDLLAAGRDQLVSARAAVRAVELRLATGKIDKRDAAEALDRLLYAWRGDRRELALREKLASLREGLGEWRQALTLLRDTETLFPDNASAIHARLQSAFDALLQNGAADQLPPLEFVALVNENADLVPHAAQGAALDEKLADKLLALDLPDRAAPVLDKLMRGAPAGPGRATIGLRLATLRYHEGDANGALTALDASETPGLPAPLHEQRTLLRASAQAQTGNVAGAVNLLAGLDSAAAAGEIADIMERAQNWRGAERALAAYAAKTLPPGADLTDESRRLLLRLATAASNAGDEQMLAALRARDEARMGSGPLGDMFRLLTAGPVHGVADLPRSAREVGLAKALPTALEAMQPRPRSP